MGNWFEELTGFKETDYESTRRKLVFNVTEFSSVASHKRHDLGKFEMPSLAQLRERISSNLAKQPPDGNPLGQPVGNFTCDAYDLHRREVANGAVIQVASQFNLLEMPSPAVTPEHGVTNYMHDRTQGPACAMAAGPATLFRNYGIPVGDQFGQTATVQINTIDDLLREIGVPGVNMKNGYAICDQSTLKQIHLRLGSLAEGELKALKGLLKVGVHWSTAVSAPGAPSGQKVTQVFCSALPIAYNGHREAALWEPFARLILDACYEATICVGILNSMQTGNPNVFLTRVGGGVFGNPPGWIDDAIERAIQKHDTRGLQIRMVSRA